MQTVSGQIARFLGDPRAGLQGFVLDSGHTVCFPAEQGHLVSLLVHIGSRVGIEGVFHPGDPGEEYWEPALMTNLDSQGSLTFLTPNRTAGPGMPADATTPNPTAASLVQGGLSGSNGAISEAEAAQVPPASPPTSDSHPPPHHAQKAVSRNDAAAAVGESYDRLHRVQAIVAYLRIMKRNVPGIGQLLDEAKHTYEQALSRFHARSFVASAEFAAASASLSRVVEILISRSLRSDSGLPSLVPPPPDLYSYCGDSTNVEADLHEAEFVLSRVHWLLERGTLPLEDRTQVRKIASWGDALYKQAQHAYHHVSLPDAVELAQAALAGAHSAEHVCRKWYVGQTARSGDRASELSRSH